MVYIKISYFSVNLKITKNHSMKKILTGMLILLTVQFVNAQSEDENTFKKFKVDVSFGYAVPQGSGTKGGGLFVIEPKYAVVPEVSVGLRIEGAAMANIDASGSAGKISVLQSYLGTGDYYFTSNRFRPFAGAGAGLYKSASAFVSDSSSTVIMPSTSQFGFMARAGFEFGHFRLGVEYNFLKQNQSYLGVKFGVCIGGGRIE